MSNLHNFQGVVIGMTSQSHHVTQARHESRETIKTKDICFCEESFIDRSFLVLEILRRGDFVPPIAAQAKKAHGEQSEKCISKSLSKIINKRYLRCLKEVSKYAHNPASICFFISSKSTMQTLEKGVKFKLTIETPEQRH